MRGVLDTELVSNQCSNTFNGQNYAVITLLVRVGVWMGGLGGLAELATLLVAVLVQGGWSQEEMQQWCMLQLRCAGLQLCCGWCLWR